MSGKIEVPPIGVFLERLYKEMPERPRGLTDQMILDGETKRVSLDIGPQKHPDFIELMMLTDLQFGSKGFQEDKFIKYRDWILGRPHCFVALGGDLVDAATQLSIANTYENRWEPSEQVFRLIDLLKPLRGRIISSVAGNHERRTVKGFGNAGLLIAALLGVPYSRGVQLVDIYYGKHQPFKASIWHGTGASKTKGAKAQMLHRFMAQADSDVYLCGHLHDVVLLFDWRQRRSGRKGVALDKIAGVMSSSFQAYWNSYAEEKGLSPSDTMMARVQIEIGGSWGVELR